MPLMVLWDPIDVTDHCNRHAEMNVPVCSLARNLTEFGRALLGVLRVPLHKQFHVLALKKY